MQRGKRPIGRRSRQSVLDRIEMHVIGTAFEIAVVANGVLAKPPLPKRIFTTMISQNLDARGENASRETPLDPTPPVGKIRVIRRQCQNCMQVVGENDDGVDNKRPFALRFSKCDAQQLDVIDQYRRPSVIQRDREEKRHAGDEIAPIMNHGASLPRIALRSIRATGVRPPTSRRPIRKRARPLKNRRRETRRDRSTLPGRCRQTLPTPRRCA